MIDAYDFGYMVIDGKRYTSDCIVTSRGVNATWWRRNGHELAVVDISDIIEKEGPQTIVVGKGKYGMMKILPETVQYLKSRGIEVMAAHTDDAAAKYNSLEHKEAVVGFFHLTC